MMLISLIKIYTNQNDTNILILFRFIELQVDISILYYIDKLNSRKL